MDAWQFPAYAYALILATLLAFGIAAVAWPRRSAIAPRTKAQQNASNSPSAR